jgi:hypothetical protein
MAVREVPAWPVFFAVLDAERLTVAHCDGARLSGAAAAADAN